MVPAAAVQVLFFGGGAVSLGAAVTTIVVNLAIAAVLGKVLEPKLKGSSRESKALQTTIRSNITPRRVIYGEAIVGGPYVVLETIGLDNETLSMVIAIAGHPVEDILGVFIDDEYIDVSGPNNSSNDLDTLYWVDQGKYGTGNAVDHIKIIKNNGWGYADIQYVQDKNGTDPTADRARGALIASYLNTTWTQPATTTRDGTTGIYTDSGYKLTNCAHIFLSFKFNPDVFSGFPQVRFHVKGKRLYNPYLDGTKSAYGSVSGGHLQNGPDTWEYSDNWALCCLDYLRNESYGLAMELGGLLPEIDWASFIEAYVDSSEQITNGLPSPNTGTVDRYTINGVFEVNETPISIMESLLNSGSGFLIYSQGTYKLRAGVYKAPSSPNDIINEDFMVSGLTIQTHVSRSQLFNKVAGVYVDIGYDKAFAPSTTNLPLFEPTDFEIVDPLDSSGLNPYEVLDGEEIIKEVDYPFTIHQYEAQRLARIQLERVRKGLTVSFEANLKMLKYSVGDNVYLEILNNSKYANEAFYNRLGFDGAVQDRPDSPFTPYYKQFRIVDMQYTENFTINVVMIEEDEQIYDWNDGDANLIDHALISEIVFDDPTGTITKPTFSVASPVPTIDEVISWPNISLFIRWTAASRGSTVNALDRAHVRSYNLEYGEVTNVSAVDPADRVGTWIKAGSYIVEDFTSEVQGPISIENVFIDEVTTFDFRIQAVLFNGRKSAWAYYSEDEGSDYSPTAPPTAEISTPVAGAKTVIYDTQITSNSSLDHGQFILADSTDYTPNYLTIDAMYFSSYDINDKEHNRFFNAIRVGDTVTMYLSAKRWYKYRFTDNTLKSIQFQTSNSPYTGARILAYSLSLIDYKDSDPTNTTTITTNTEFRFERDATVDTIVELLDLNFDETLVFGGANDNGRWNKSAVTSPDLLEFQAGAGEDGTGAVYWYGVPPGASTTTATMRSNYSFRNPGTDTKVSIRYQSISGVELTNPFRIRYQYSTYPFNVSGTAGTDKLVDFPATGSGVWSTLTVIIPKEQGAFLGIILESVQNSSDSTFDLLIDSINIEPANLSYGLDAVLSGNTAKLVYEQTPYHVVDMNPATGTVTINLISGLSTGQSAVMSVKTIQDTTASRSITWQGNGSTGNIYWAGGTTPTPTSTGNAEDFYTFSTVDGTNWIGSVILDVQ